MSPLSNHNLKQNLPESVINIFNKIYSRRMDFEKQAKKYSKDRNAVEQNIARVDAKLGLIQSLNGKIWQEAAESNMKSTIDEKREQMHDKVRAKLEKEINEL